MAIATVLFEYRHIYDHRFGQESTYCFTLLYCGCGFIPSRYLFTYTIFLILIDLRLCLWKVNVNIRWAWIVFSCKSCFQIRNGCLSYGTQYSEINRPDYNQSECVVYIIYPLRCAQRCVYNIDKTDAMYTTPCTGSAVFLCTRPVVHGHVYACRSLPM